MSRSNPNSAELAASLDAAALEALASKGLLRRAQKDLERGCRRAIAGERDSTLRLRVGDFEVTLPESGPRKREMLLSGGRRVPAHPDVGVVPAARWTALPRFTPSGPAAGTAHPRPAN